MNGPLHTRPSILIAYFLLVCIFSHELRTEHYISTLRKEGTTPPTPKLACSVLIQGYIFLQIPYFLRREAIQQKLKLGKKFRREQKKCVHEMGKKFNGVVK